MTEKGLKNRVFRKSEIEFPEKIEFLGFSANRVSAKMFKKKPWCGTRYVFRAQQCSPPWAYLEQFDEFLFVIDGSDFVPEYLVQDNGYGVGQGEGDDHEELGAPDGVGSHRQGVPDVMAHI